MEGKFDSNSITPGTEFMVRLQEGLRAFVQSKLATDPLWKAFRVIFSGHEVPAWLSQSVATPTAAIITLPLDS